MRCIASVEGFCQRGTEGGPVCGDLCKPPRVDLVAHQRVIVRYALLSSSGHPKLCQPSRAERAGRKHPAPGNDGKVIYPDVRAAKECARELQLLGLARQRAYPCTRSNHGHHHLTSKQRRKPSDGSVTP